MLHYGLSNIVIGFIIWFPVAYFSMAIFEYVAHRWFMHKKTFLTQTQFKHHAVQHHGHHIMEPMFPYIDLPISCHLIYGSPGWGALLVGFLCGGPYALGGLIATLTIFAIHSYFYSKVHRAQHDLEENWTQRLPWFAELKRHHLDHHIRPSRNFAVVFLWTDRLFGTYWRSEDVPPSASRHKSRKARNSQSDPQMISANEILAEKLD